MTPPGVDQLLVRGDHGRIVIGAITRIIGCLAILVVLFHDGVMLGVAQVTTDQDAAVAARAAAQNWQQTKDVQKSYEAAALAVQDKGTEIDAASFKVDTYGEVTLTASRRTSTMVADRFSLFDNVTHPHSTTSAKVDPST